MKRAAALLLIALGLQASDLPVSFAEGEIVDRSIRWSVGAEAARLLGDIGIRLKKSEAADSIRVQFTTKNLSNPGYIAYVTSFASPPVVTIMYDRVVELTDRRPDLRAAFLADVLVHELGHAVMKTDHHSSTGVMKARWSVGDVLQMGYRRLQFTANEAELIRKALAPK